MIRYRNGINRVTGKPLSGAAHLRQSVADILTTLKGERLMRLDYGTELIRKIGRNLHRDLVLRLYAEIVAAIHQYEPEFRVKHAQIVTLDATGTLGLKLGGTYYPHGRLGDYTIAEPISLNVPFAGAPP